MGYNNPSFGYGGYCLPKDTKQLKYQFKDIENNELINAIVESNESRKKQIVSHVDNILKQNKCKVVGIYRTVMKSGSDNSRQSSCFDVIEGLLKLNYKVVVYEPTLQEYKGLDLYADIDKFKTDCDLIIANRVDSVLKDVDYKVFSRDIFGDN